MDKKRLLGIAYYIITAVVIIHHYIICGKWFELEDILHHEVLALVSATIATMLFLDP